MHLCLSRNREGMRKTDNRQEIRTGKGNRRTRGRFPFCMGLGASPRTSGAGVRDRFFPVSASSVHGLHDIQLARRSKPNLVSPAILRFIQGIISRLHQLHFTPRGLRIRGNPHAHCHRC